ncbi:MAG: Nucleolar protein 9 [Vezdaea aestivalis]|nr:MAG: Nucleolar protein 9 [Vezdaea aestivalis]
MPQQNKKIRSRRPKTGDDYNLSEEHRVSKRKRDNVQENIGDDTASLANSGSEHAPQGYDVSEWMPDDVEQPEIQFFGFLTEDEHAQIERANDELDANQFSVSEECFASVMKENRGGFSNLTNGNDSESMEDLFLLMLDELEGNFAFLMTDKFGSHALRSLLSVVRGVPLNDESKTKASSRPGPFEQQTHRKLESREHLPESFTRAAEKILSDITSGLDVGSARSLSLHPSANPVLQSLLHLEKHITKRQSDSEPRLLKLLITEDKIDAESESYGFISGLIYDPIGSRLLEQILICCNGKLFKSLYRAVIKPKLSQYVKNEVASYVAIASLDRLGKDDLAEALAGFVLDMSDSSKRPQTTVIRKLVERCVFRGVDMDILRTALTAGYGTNSARFLFNLLGVEPIDLENKEKRLQPQVVHASLLAQSMIDAPAALSNLVYSSLGELSERELVTISCNAISSRILQKALTSESSELAFRRKIVRKLTEYMGILAADLYGGHVLDALWVATSSLFIYKERVAEKLLANETMILASGKGWIVWRNWDMETFKSTRQRWAIKHKSGKGHSKISAERREGVEIVSQKSRLDLARQRYGESKRSRML